ncbi:MAG: FlgD immunoglobulin-like domain containing protein [Candidatus Zixiibacteriota bacterium]
MKSVLTILSTITIILLSGCAAKQASYDCDHEVEYWRNCKTQEDSFGPYKIIPQVKVTRLLGTHSRFNIIPFIEYYLDDDSSTRGQDDSLVVDVQNVTLITSSDTVVISREHIAEISTFGEYIDSNIVTHYIKMEDIETNEFPNAITMALDLTLWSASGDFITGSVSKAYLINPQQVYSLIPTIEVSKNFPNPFSPTTGFTYRLTKPMDIVVTVWDIKGQLVDTVLNEHQKWGEHSVSWDGRDSKGQTAPSGIYFFHFSSLGMSIVEKLILFR